MNIPGKFWIMRVTMILVIALISFTGHAQELALSGFTVHTSYQPDGNGGETYTIQVALSKLLHGTTLELKVAMDSSCVGVFMDYLHVKKYANDYYLKYRGKRTLLEGKTIRCEIDIKDGLPWQSATFCLQGKSPNGKLSNTLYYTVETP